MEIVSFIEMFFGILSNVFWIVAAAGSGSYLEIVTAVTNIMGLLASSLTG